MIICLLPLIYLLFIRNEKALKIGKSSWSKSAFEEQYNSFTLVTSTCYFWLNCEHILSATAKCIFGNKTIKPFGVARLSLPNLVLISAQHRIHHSKCFVVVVLGTHTA